MDLQMRNRRQDLQHGQANEKQKIGSVTWSGKAIEKLRDQCEGESSYKDTKIISMAVLLAYLYGWGTGTLRWGSSTYYCLADYVQGYSVHTIVMVLHLQNLTTFTHG
jgi:hypothetical protein